MGAFRYCRCEHPLPKPTPREDLIEDQICPGCGEHQRSVQSRDEWIVELWEEIQEMNKSIACINAGLAPFRKLR